MGNWSPGTQWGDNSRWPRISWPNKPRGQDGHSHQSVDAIRVAGTSLGTNVSHGAVNLIADRGRIAIDIKLLIHTALHWYLSDQCLGNQTDALANASDSQNADRKGIGTLLTPMWVFLIRSDLPVRK